MKRNHIWGRKTWLACVCAAALIAVVFVSGVLDKQKTWADMPYLMMRFDGGMSRDTAQGGAYGVMNEGPGLTLPAGTYRLKWHIEADGDNRIELVSRNGAVCVPGEIALSADEPAGEAQFTLKEAAQGVELRVVFESGTHIRVADMRLYSPVYTDHAWTFALLALGACALYLLHARGWLTPCRRGKLILLGLAVLIASGPAFKDTIGIGHDTTFHLVRLCNLADGLKSGFPVRAGGL